MHFIRIKKGDATSVASPIYAATIEYLSLAVKKLSGLVRVEKVKG
jgi:hypothetical protein